MNIPDPVYVPPRSTHLCLSPEAWLSPLALFPSQEGPGCRPSIVVVWRPGCHSWVVTSGWEASTDKTSEGDQTTVARCCLDWAFRSSSGFLEGVWIWLRCWGEINTMQWTLTNGRLEMRAPLRINCLPLPAPLPPDCSKCSCFHMVSVEVSF